MPKYRRSEFAEECWARYHDKDDLWNYMSNCAVSVLPFLTY